MKPSHKIFTTVVIAAAGFFVAAALPSAEPAFDATAAVLKQIGAMKVKPGDWPQWAGTTFRNNVPQGKGIATEWSIEDGKNIKWSAKLGSENYGNPVIANGHAYVGTNNGSGYVKRYPSKVDLGCLLCFDEVTGKFLWQHSSEKLPTGRVHDWPNLGICSAPLVDGNRLWYITNRDEVCCLDTEGFLDGKNDGPYKQEPNTNKDEADIIWKIDLMGKFGVSQHNACGCSVTAAGDILFVNTSNGVDEAHFKVPQPDAPSFMGINRTTGEVVWSDNSPGVNILHGQWSSPGYGVLGGVPQVLFGGGDGWLYSFDPQGENGKSKLLWKFDCNPKESIYKLDRATRNHIIGTPVIYDGLVYIAVGEDPEHGEGGGHLWCIDPTKRGDVSPQLVFNSKDPKTPLARERLNPAKRFQAADPKLGDLTRDNPNSAAVWHYVGSDAKKFDTTMHRTCGTAAIKDNLLFIADFSGLFHCLDAKTGKPHWTYDMLAAAWASPLIVDGHVYIGDEDGDITVFNLSATKDKVAEINMGSAVYTTPVVANNVLFISNKNELFAIAQGSSLKRVKSKAPQAAADSD